MSLLDFLTRGAQSAVQRGRGLLDDFTQPGISATPGAIVDGTQHLAPGVNPAMAPDGLGVGEGGPVSNVGPMRQAPVVSQTPSLIGRAWDWAKSREGKLAIGSALAALGGDEDAALRAQAVRDNWRSNEELAAKNSRTLAERRRLSQAIKSAYVDDGYGNRRFDGAKFWDIVADTDPSSALDAYKSLAADSRRHIVSNSRGIYAVDPDGQGVERLQQFDRQAPAGFQWNEDGTDLELIPGYAEGIGRVAGVRRDAVVDRPMPQRGRPGGARAPAGAPPPPGPGYRVVVEGP